MTTIFPRDGALRLDELVKCDRSNLSPDEDTFDDLTRLAARICQMPVALICLTDRKHHWLRSHFGMDKTQAKRYLALCKNALQEAENCQSGLILASDASDEQEFAASPLAADKPRIRFYAGAPLAAPDGTILGVLCVMDYKPRSLSIEVQEALKALSRQATSQLELRQHLVCLERTIADRQQIEQACREREESFRLLVTNSTNMVSRHTPEGIYLYVSPACRTLLGYEPEELVGRSVYEFLHPEDLTELVKSNSTRREIPNTYTLTYRIRTKSDRYIWFETTSRTVRDEETGEVMEIQAVSCQITECDRTAEELLELAAIVESSNDAIISKTLNGIILSWNAAAQKIYGYSADEVKGRSISILLPPDRSDEMQQILEKIQRGEPIKHYETVRLTKDGSLIHVSLTISPIKDITGKIIGASTISRDITLAKWAEESLQQSEQRFRFLAEAIPQQIWTAQSDGALDYVNQRVLAYFGRTFEEIIGWGWQDMLHPEDVPQCIERWTESLTTGNLYEIEFRLLRAADSTYRWHLGRAIPLYDDGGKIVSWFGTNTDIDDRKRAEEELREVSSALENAVEGISRLDAQGCYIAVNRAYANVCGYQPEEMIGMEWKFTVHANDRAKLSRTYQQMIGDGKAETEARGVRKDGSIFYKQVVMVAAYDSQGQFIGHHCFMKDITERKQAEEERLQILAREQVARAEAQAAENRIRNILESITDAFFTLDNEWRFTYLNLRAKQILFRPGDELIGKCIWDEFPEFIGSNFELEYRRAVSRQATVYFEEFYSPLGIWFEVRAYPYQDGLSVYFRDVTERKHSEASMLERSRLATLEAEVGKTLGQGGALQESLHACTEAMFQHLDANFAGIWTFNQQHNWLELQAISRRPEIEIPDPQLLYDDSSSLDGSLIGFVARSRQQYLTQDSSNPSRSGFEIRMYDDELAESCSLIADSYFGGYPLIIEQRLVGVMAVGRSQPFTEGVHDLLGWVANAISVAIDRTWARKALLSRREALLFRLASQIRNSLDLDTILGTAVSEIRSLLQIDRCHFLWCWPHPQRPSLTVTHESRGNPNLQSMMGDYSIGHVLALINKMRNLEPVRINDMAIASDLDEHADELLHRFGITSQLLLPLKTHAGQLGAIVCSHCRGPRSWLDSEVELLQAVVDQLACAIDQAEHYAQTRATARAAQTQAEQLELTLRELKQAQSQLIQTEKMSSLGQMVAGIAHEINNPVSFITGNLSHTSSYMQDLLDLVHLYQKHYPHPNPEIQEHTEEIDLEFLLEDLPKMISSMQMGADRISQIVLSLRNFSRLDEAEKKPVDIHEGLDNTLLILHHRLKANGGRAEIRVIKEYGNLPNVECYACQMNQVFMNILSNAIDALENQKDPRIITICTEIASSNSSSLIGHSSSSIDKGQKLNDCVVIRIRDNGSGMTTDIKKRLFDPFFTTKPVGKGTGLGMSISYQIVVEKHGGVLDCISEPGHGTEFWIQIPLQQ